MSFRPETSLHLRLILSSLVWTVVSLALSGVLIVSLFRDHIEKRFDSHLVDHIGELVAASETSALGKLQLTWSPTDPRFNRPHSGWYWEIQENARVIHQSTSLLTATIFHDEMHKKVGQFFETTGPSGEPIRLYSQQISFPRSSEKFLFIVAGPVSDISGDIQTFSGMVLVVLSALSLALAGMIVLQIKYGLAPLKRLRQSLSEIRSGERQKLPEDFPKEIQPLASELNTLLDYNFTLLDRARTQVGNLAHSLKNPIAVLKNETKDIPGSKGDTLRQQLETASQSISRYLNKARIAGSASLLGTKADLGSVLNDLIFSLEKLYDRHDIRIRMNEVEAVSVRADPQDMEELFGNLIENACKWSRGHVEVSVTDSQETITILIEDDGPGVPESQIESLVERGVRLDETKPGTGLGLNIAKEILELYDGRLEFFQSDLGGLGVKVSLPRKI